MLGLYWFTQKKEDDLTLGVFSGHEPGGVAALLRRVPGGCGGATLVDQGWGGEQSHDAPRLGRMGKMGW